MLINTFNKYQTAGKNFQINKFIGSPIEGKSYKYPTEPKQENISNVHII